jgi:hypothetical protein
MVGINNLAALQKPGVLHGARLMALGKSNLLNEDLIAFCC